MASHGLRDPDLRRLRALRMIELRIKGNSLKQIAEEFGVSTDTVDRTLSWAKKAELVVEAEDKILRELVPAAQNAILAVLAGTDDEVKAKTALEIFKGTLPSFSKAKQSNGPTVSDSGSLSSYIDQLRNDLLTEGEVVPERSPQRQITAGASSPPSEGLSVSVESDGNPSESPRDASGGE